MMATVAQPYRLDRWKIELSPLLSSSSSSQLQQRRRQVCDDNGGELDVEFLACKNIKELQISSSCKKEKRNNNNNNNKIYKENIEQQQQRVEQDQEQSRESFFVMNNYFSIGVDAEIVLGFHEMREKNTHLFQGVLLNKGWYAGFSAKAAFFSQNTTKLSKLLSIYIDGEEMIIPKNIRSIVVMNIPSYGGANVWGTRSSYLEDFQEPSVNDGLLEVVGMTGVTHLGAIQTGVASGKRLAQGSRIELISGSKPLPTQVDGEPCVLTPHFRVTITHLNQATLLFNSNLFINSSSSKISPRK